MRPLLPLLVLAACDGPAHLAGSPTTSPSLEESAAGSAAVHASGLRASPDSPTRFGLSVRGQELQVQTEGRSGFGLRLLGWGRAGRRLQASESLAPVRCDALPEEVQDSCAEAWMSATPELTSWWMLRPDGVQQGWTIPQAPEGAGDLTFDVALPGASELEILEEGLAASFLDSEERPWRVQGVRAWDARGEPLPAVLSWTGEALRVSVDAEGAVWPVNVDPLYTTVTSTWSGSTSYARFGSSVAVLDANGDGYNELVVGAEGDDYSIAGRAFVYAGSATGIAAASSVTLTGSTDPFHSYGSVVLNAGDVNNDGNEDLIVGAPGWSTTPTSYDYVGRLYVYHGSSSGIRSTVTTTRDGTTTYPMLMSGLRALGDLDGDGYDEVGIQRLGFTNSFLIYEGTSSGLESSPAELSISYCTLSDYDGAGDVNGDGYDDILVGGSTSSYTYGNNGCVMVLHGTSGYPVLDESFAGSRLSALGDSVEPMGDLDADGYADVVVTAPSEISGSRYTGAIFGFYGSPSGMRQETLVAGVERVTEGVGTFAYAVGDLDGDGVGDLLYSADSYPSSSTFWTVYHPESSTHAATSTLWNYSAGDWYDNVYAAGDVDNDGRDDVLASDDYATVGSIRAAGKVVLYRGYRDDDGDGSATEDDCDDSDATVYPGATEVVNNGIDEDCDGGDGCYTDSDRDGYGSATVRASIDLDCLDAGEARTSTDCDDTRATAYPGATETVADGVDQDCDGGDTCYADSDVDGYGSVVATVSSVDLDCADSGESTTRLDCDDALADIWPGGTEVVGDGVDQDCDGGDSCYSDGDTDGYGSATVRASADLDCLDAGESTSVTDCDDARATAYPGAPETVADGVDQDCDGGDMCHVDADLDGFGSGSGTVSSSDTDCADSGESPLSTDCDDIRSDIRPGQTELVADGVDQDCDGGDTCYADGDGDGFGTNGTLASGDLDCGDAGESASSSDCADGDARAFPGAALRDGLDCMQDRDEDGFGDAFPASSVTPGTDCDDASATTFPGAAESEANPESCRADADDDGFGDAAARSPVLRGSDCDDTAADVSPAATEVPADSRDGDCDGTEACFVDADRDGYGGTVTRVSLSVTCSNAGESGVSGDCDEADPSVHPEALELVADGIDQDCDGGDVCHADIDQDGYASASGQTVTSPDLDCSAPGEASAEVPHTDCDDARDDIHPTASEIPVDGLDQDCDGGDSCRADQDGDGLAAPGDVVVASLDLDCLDEGEAGAEVGTDCDDSSAGIGMRRWYRDADGDGYGSATFLDACVAEEGWSLVGGDCDDTDADAATAPETCFAAAVGCSSGASAPGSVAALALAGLTLLSRRRRRS